MSISDFLPICHMIVEEETQPKIKKINEYLLVGKLGTGYFSKVYLALDSNEKENTRADLKYYAAKAVHAHTHINTTKTLEREIKFLREFDHPNIIKLHTVLYAPTIDIAYIVMEWANCGTLQQAISKNDIFDEREMASIFIQIALALSYLHSKEIIHRDVKPSNILLFSDGTAKLSDFGISQSTQNAEHVCGTPSYQAPDLFEEVNPDLFTYFIDDDDSDQNHFYLKDEKKVINFSKCSSDDNDSILVKNNEEKYYDSKNNNFKINGKCLNKINREKECQIDPKKGDVWSLGISMYQTAYGVLPYEGNDVYEIVNKINNSPLIIPSNKERQYSPLFVDLIVKMLKKKFR